MQNLRGFLGVDTGGTFTDFYWYGADGARFHKLLSTPDEPEQAIMQGIEDLGLTAWVRSGSVIIVHGSTVATNAVLEGKGVRTAYVTNRGFADLLTLARQNRDDIYALSPRPVAPPVDESLCVEMDCRRDARGEVVTALTQAEIDRCVDQIRSLNPRAVAINFLYSYISAEDEQRLADGLKGGVFLSLSSTVLPEIREYERGVATWLNAWIGPNVDAYLRRLRTKVGAAPLAVMQSSGGTIEAGQASGKAVNLLLSGPAGGLAAAQYLGRQSSERRLLTFDMGGTSTDVALIDGEIKITTEGRLGIWPVAVPMVDLHSIGAGGGSIARLDAGGLLHVGPESAGAQPGPACYGRGGTEPTVTDANVVPGRLRPDFFLGGRMQLQYEPAERAVSTVARLLGVTLVEAAQGIVATANEQMVNALRLISVQRGHDPAAFELCSFGGAGGLHVCAIAEELGILRIVVPAFSGIFSAFGMLVAPRQRYLSLSVVRNLEECDMEFVQHQVSVLQQQARSELESEGMTLHLATQVTLDCRYSGQSFCLSVPMAETAAQIEQDFHRLHQKNFGHRVELPVELVTIRVKVEAPSPLQPDQVPASFADSAPVETVMLPDLGETRVWLRAELAPGQIIAGPSVVCEEVSTTLIAPGWMARLDHHGHLRLARGGAAIRSV